MNENERRLAEEILALAKANAKILAFVFEVLEEAKIVEQRTILRVLRNTMSVAPTETQGSVENHLHQFLVDALSAKIRPKLCNPDGS